jgi:hypothetical protein
MATYKHEGGWVENSSDKDFQEEVDRYDRTEREREWQRRAEHQAELNRGKPQKTQKTWRELELEQQDRLDAMWKRAGR